MELTRVDGIGRPIDTERPLPLLLWQQTPEYKKQLKQLARKIDPISVEFRDKLFGCITGNVFDTPNGAHLVEAEPLDEMGFAQLNVAQALRCCRQAVCYGFWTQQELSLFLQGKGYIVDAGMARYGFTRISNQPTYDWEV